MQKLSSLKKITQEFTLLYAEDNPELRDTTTELFKMLFKDTVVASNGAEALKLYNEHHQKNGIFFDIVITDMNMPKLNGIELSKEIFTLNKAQNIIVISAYDDKEYLIEFINIGITGFIQKPLTSEQMVSILYDSCNDLAQKKELFRFVELGCDTIWDTKYKTLSHSGEKITLTDNETKLFSMFTQDINRQFTTLEIFEYIYNSEKEFSLDIIKSMFKRLRKKIPKDLIINTPHLGYSLQL